MSVRSTLRALAVTTSASLCLALAACGGDDAPTAAGADAAGGGGEQITVLTSADFPPLSFRQEGNSREIVGFEMDMLKAITDHLGISYRLTTGEFSGLVPAVQSGRADMVLSDIYNTEERRRIVDFVDYVRNRFSVMVRADDEGRVRGFEDLCGRTMGILTGSAPEQKAADRANQTCTEAGKEPIRVRSFPSVAQELPQLDNGGIDAILETYTSLVYVDQRQPGKYHVAFDDETTESTVGAVFQKGSELKSRWEEGFEWYVSSGTYERHARKWKLPENTLIGTGA